MSEELFRDRVRERDLDNFLVEELQASTAFRDWLLARLPDAFEPPAEYEVRLQKSPARLQDARQTDVQIGWFDPSGALAACVLIESKVTADFQPGQAESYLAEVTAARGALGPNRATSLLVAPAARLATLRSASFFDASVSIEDIADALADRRADGLAEELDSRLSVRVQLLEALCGRGNTSTWIGNTVPEKRDFAKAYAALALQRLPGLRVSASTDGRQAITRLFTGLTLPGLPVPRLRHEYGQKVAVKWVNAQFPGLVDKVPDVRASGLLAGSPYSAEPAEGSLAIRVPTPGIDPEQSFASQRHAVIEGLDAMGALVAWLEANAGGLAAVLAVAPPTPKKLASTRTASESRDVRAVERDLATALREIYVKCDALGYRPTAMLEMVGRLGALETVRRLVAQPMSEGFGRLAAMGHLELAVETLVLDARWDGVFTDDERRIARRKLGR